jgi:anti-sigma B factor antagonist
MPEAAGRDCQLLLGGGVHPFHLESITAGGDCAVLRIGGDIDAYAAPQIRDRVAGLAGAGAVHIVADLRGAGFLDSAGLGALVGSRTELRARGGSLTVVASSGRILQVLRIAGVSDAFALHSRVRAADVRGAPTANSVTSKHHAGCSSYLLNL